MYNVEVHLWNIITMFVFCKMYVNCTQVPDIFDTGHRCIIIDGPLWNIISIVSPLKSGRLTDCLQMTCVLSFLCLPVLECKKWLTFIAVLTGCWIITWISMVLTYSMDA